MENAVLDPVYCDPKDSGLLIENDNIINNEQFRFYVDVMEENFQLSLEQPQVAKTMYDKLEEEFYGLSATYHDTDGKKIQNGFRLMKAG